MSARTDQLHALHAAAERLSAPAEVQIAYLTEAGSPRSADELALEFDDYYPSVRHWITDDAFARALKELDDALERMSSSDRADLWTLDGLAAPEWGNIRALALVTLTYQWDVSAAPNERDLTT